MKIQSLPSENDILLGNRKEEKGSHPNDYETTNHTAIGNLGKYRIHLKNDGSWMPMYAMTKTQRELFAEFGLSQQKVEENARSVTLRV